MPGWVELAVLRALEHWHALSAGLIGLSKPVVRSCGLPAKKVVMMNRQNGFANAIRLSFPKNYIRA
jgi:hypothetical protein